MTLSEFTQIAIIWGGILWPILMSTGLLVAFDKRVSNSTSFWILSVSVGYGVMFIAPQFNLWIGPMTSSLLLFALPIVISVIFLRLHWVKADRVANKSGERTALR